MELGAKLVHGGDEKHIHYIARVSSNQDNADPGLLSYLIRNGHWSPFEMVGACVEINTTRDIGRQILRHRSFSFQEFSGRYATYNDLVVDRDIRFKGAANRQASRPAQSQFEKSAAGYFKEELKRLSEDTLEVYNAMIGDGVAAECARAILPEGLVPTRIYMNGTLRSWLHYIRERRKPDAKTGVILAQREHYDIAGQIRDALAEVYPVTFEALSQINYFEEVQ